MITSFSTKDSRPQDAAMIREVKMICHKKNINFSSLIVKLVKEWKDEYERTSKI